MARNDINLNVNVDGTDSVNDAVEAVENLGDAAESSQESLNELGESSDLFSDIKSKIQGAISSVKAFANSFRTVRGAIAATGIGALLLAVTSLVSYFKNTERGARTLSIATEALGIMMNKVTDVLVVLGEKLFYTFTHPKEAILNLKDLIKTNITNRIKGLIELFPKLGEAISLTFEGKWKDAAKVSADAIGKVAFGVEDITDKAIALKDKAVETFNTVVEETKKAVVAATAYVAAQNNLRNAINSLTIENANLNKELEKQQKIGEDTTRGYDERRVALEAAGEAQVQLSKNLAHQAKLEEDLLRVQIANTRDIATKNEMQSQLSEQIAARIDAESALLQTELDVKQVIKELDIEELERKAAINDLIRDANVDNTLSKYEAALQQLAIDEEAALLELTLLKATETEKQELRNGFEQQRIDLKNEKLAEERIVAEKLAEEEKEALLEQQKREKEHQEELTRIAKEEEEKRLEQKRQNNQLILDAAFSIGQAVVGVAELFGEKNKKAAKKAFQLNKGLQIAETSIQTFKSATAAFSSLAGIPVVGVGLGIAAAAAATTAGLLNIRKIAQTKFDEGGNDTGSIEAPSTPDFNANVSSPSEAPTPPSISLFGDANGSSVNATSNELGINQQPIKAYVVESDITKTQNTLQNYQNRSEIG